MAKLTFLGATGTVTGSRYLLETAGKKILVDCGLFQGPKKIRLRNWDPFPVFPGEIDMMLLTHAHIDHSGYLPRLVKYGFSGPVYCTHATCELSGIMLRDSAHLQEEDAYWANKKGFSKHSPALPLYTGEDAEQAIKLLRPVNYGESIYLNDNTRIKFKDAGHILGSSVIDFKVQNGQKSRKIMFSGDLGRPSRPVLKEPVQVYNVDYLVIESTYGDRLHEHSQPDEELARVVNQSVERGGVLVIPSFSVGRTQTLLYVLRELEEANKIPSLPVYIDSPMAIRATEVFRDRIPDLNLESRVTNIEGTSIFQPKRLHSCKTREQSISINDVRSKAIIISASGMVTGGRILHHLAERLPGEHNTVLFIGYQAEGTRGRTLLEGKPEVKIHGQMVPVLAKIENISGYSGHADYNEILAYLMAFNKKPEKVFLVHGEPEASASLAQKIKKEYGWDTVIPEHEQSFNLDLQ